jgi:dihydrolipoamide dehydrogenase
VMTPYDLIVIGGGPAGYVGAIRAAQLGKRVACVEKERAGGTCLNWGCIPTKALLRNAELFSFMEHQAKEFGFSFDNLSYDWTRIVQRSREVADKNAAGIEYLFKKHKIDYVRGEAVVDRSGVVSVRAGDQSQMLEGENILVSTGVVSRPMPGLPFNGTTVIGSREAMVLARQPKSIVIIGAGAIGVEFAYFFNAFGTKVTLVEMRSHLLPLEDDEVSQSLERAFRNQGINYLTDTKVVKAEAGSDSVRITAHNQRPDVIEAEVCLVAIGVQPLLPGGAPFKLTDRGYLEIDNRYQTSLPRVHAAGDIIGPPWLAHVASYEAIQAVEGMFTDHHPKRVAVFPSCTYCHPQVASVGLSEHDAREKGLKVKVGKFPFMANGKARAIGEIEGFVKLVFGEPHGELLGAHIIGPEATEMIAELSLAITMEATYEEIEATIHAHPTLSEAVHEATGQAFGEAIHI